MHDPLEKYTSGRTHNGTIHVWVHHSVAGNSFGSMLFVDGSLMCKHGAQGGQRTSWFARFTVYANFAPCAAPRRAGRTIALLQALILSELEHLASRTVQPHSKAWSAARSGGQRYDDLMLMCGGENGRVSETSV